MTKRLGFGLLDVMSYRVNGAKEEQGISHLSMEPLRLV
jgi:hypothetical protein